MMITSTKCNVYLAIYMYGQREQKHVVLVATFFNLCLTHYIKKNII